MKIPGSSSNFFVKTKEIFISSTTIQTLSRLLLALLCTLVINFKVETATDLYPYTTVLGCFLMRLSNAFFSVSFSDILSFLCIYFILTYIFNKKLPNSIFYLILSIILSSVYIICVSFRYYDGLDMINESLFQAIYSIILITGFSVLIYNSIRIINHFICTGRFQSDNTDRGFKTLWKKCFFLMIILWIPWLLSDYPGSFCIDTIWQIQQFFGYTPLDALHPPFSTVLIGSCVWIGKTLIDVNFGIFIYLLLQTIVSAAVYSYSIVKITEYGCSNKLVKSFVIFFCLYPTWGAYMQWFEKDPLYSALLVLFTILLIDVIRNDECSKKDMLKLFFSGLATALLRHNGYYTIIPTFIIFCIYFKKSNRKNMIICTLSVFITFKVLSSLVFPLAGFKSVSAKNYFCMPFQMTARYVVAYGDEITDEEYNAISGVLRFDEISDAYNPTLADPVFLALYTEDDSAIPAYIKTWVKMFFKHPNIYLSAFINNNYGYMAPVKAQIGMYFNYGQSEWETSFGLNHIFTEMPIKFFDCLKESAERWPVLQYLSMAGTYTWMIILLIAILIRNKKYTSILAFLPALLTVAFCLLSPCTSELRYCLPNMASAPLLIGWTVSRFSKQ